MINNYKFNDVQAGQRIARTESTAWHEIIAHKPYKVISNNNKYLTVITEGGSSWDINHDGFRNSWYMWEKSEDDKFRELLLDA